MKFIVACKSMVCAGWLAFSASALAYSTDKIPTVVRDPVLGLHFTIANTPLEPLPPRIITACKEMVNENIDRQSWIFAKFAAPNGTYYVAGGYFIRNEPLPRNFRKYESDDYGVLLRMAGDNCEMIDPANQSFGAASALPPEILEPLAADLRMRLENGLGGRARLKQAMRAQKIGTGSLAPAAQRGFGTP